MLPIFFKNKFLVAFLIIVVFLYATSAKVARADADILQIFSWVLTAIAIVLTIVSWGTCIICEYAVVEGLAGEAVVAGLAAGSIIAAEATLLGFTFAIDTAILLGVKAVNLGIQGGLCIQGAGFGALLGTCGAAGPEPTIYYTGAGSPTLGLPAPNITNQTITAACNAVDFDYTLANVTHYGLYRDGNLLTQSDTCFADAKTPTSKIRYTDNGPFAKSQSYTYRLDVSDSIGQTFAFPEFQKTPCP